YLGYHGTHGGNPRGCRRLGRGRVQGLRRRPPQLPDRLRWRRVHAARYRAGVRVAGRRGAAMSPDDLRDLAKTVDFSGKKDMRGEYADAAEQLRRYANVLEYIGLYADAARGSLRAVAAVAISIADEGEEA